MCALPNDSLEAIATLAFPSLAVRKGQVSAAIVELQRTPVRQHKLSAQRETSPRDSPPFSDTVTFGIGPRRSDRNLGEKHAELQEKEPYLD